MRRHLYRFSSPDGSVNVDFPLDEYEWEQSQDLRVPISIVAGAHYGWDHRGTQTGLKAVARERVRFLEIDTPAALDSSLDLLRGRLFQIGRGKLWTVGDDDSERWAWSRLASMPQLTLTVNDRVTQPVILEFLRLGDWQTPALVAVSQNVTTTSADIEVTNPGTSPQSFIVMRVRANTSAGFANWRVENLTNGYIIETNLVASSVDDELRIDTERPAIEFSDDDGVSYATAVANLVIQGLPYVYPPLAMILEPGGNTLRMTSTGTPDYEFVASFYGAYIA